MRANGVLGLMIVAGLLAAAGSAEEKVPAPSRPDGKAALERLKAMAGEWEGTVVSETGPRAKVVFGVTAAGTAVTETLFPGTDHEMLTVYHLEGNDLVLTHYCAMGNQPRMKLAGATGADPLELRFDFAGGTNFVPERDAHMHSARVTLRGANRIEAEWAVYDKGKQTGLNRFFMNRAKAVAERP